jgi:adenosylcobinamide-GDP ribazoletransferase
MTPGLGAAIATLTRLPVRSSSGEIVGAWGYGLAGAIVGLAGFVPLVILGAGVGPAAAVLAVAAMAVVSGAIHLDGLADTADALMTMGPEAAERARKDPSIGTAGALALILVVGLEVASLTALVEGPGPLVAGICCLVGGSASRAASVVVARVARSRATSEGLGAWFARRVTWIDVAVSGGTALAVAILFAVGLQSPTLLAGSLLGFGCGLALGRALVRLRRQLDGDGLGATVELTFAAILLATAAIGRWPAA